MMPVNAEPVQFNYQLGAKDRVVTGNGEVLPVYIFCRKDAFLSAMLTGDPYFHIYFYDNEKDLLTQIDEILAERT